ncbi:MAG: MFS transporter [Clostridiales Family XIII bacterium]|nr:MFS transporter [Clostridiales Family XIII bacterium]
MSGIGLKLLALFLFVISMFPMLSTDMYLPALPTVAAELHTTDAQANVTLIAFFVGFGVFTLIWGPLSDKYGRRPVLIVGFLLYTAGSVVCALSGSITAMIASRVLQGVGSGSGTAVSGAIVMDVYTGRKQEGMFAAIQSMTMVGPVVAPILGAGIISFAGWRGVFFGQAAIGVAVIIGALFFKETLREKNDCGVIRTIARLGVLMRHGRFAVIVILFSLPSMAVISYVSASPYIFQDGFGFSYVKYSVFFAACAVGSIIAPAIYMIVSRKLRRNGIVAAVFSGIAVVGALDFFFGEASPWHFAALMFLLGVFCSGSRPPGAYIVMNYHEGDAGSASSLLGSVTIFSNLFGIAAVTLYSRYILSIGIIALAVGIVGVALWLVVARGLREDKENRI